MRVTTAFKRLLDLPAVNVTEVEFQPRRVLVTVRLRRRRDGSGRPLNLSPARAPPTSTARTPIADGLSFTICVRRAAS